MPIFIEITHTDREVLGLLAEGINGVERQFAQLLDGQATIINKEQTIMASLADVQAEADQLRDLSTTLISTVNTEAANIASLQTQLAAANASGNQAAIDAISTELAATVSNLQAATSTATTATPTPTA